MGDKRWEEAYEEATKTTIKEDRIEDASSEERYIDKSPEKISAPYHTRFFGSLQVARYSLHRHNTSAPSSSV